MKMHTNMETLEIENAVSGNCEMSVSLIKKIEGEKKKQQKKNARRLKFLKRKKIRNGQLSWKEMQEMDFLECEVE